MVINIKNKVKEHSINSCLAYTIKKQEMDKLIERLITPFIQNKKLSILDACCGIGHISHQLNKVSPKSSFFAIDKTGYLVEGGKKLFIKDKNTFFKIGDVNKLPQRHLKEFDISICWKAIAFISYYEDILRTLFAITKKQYFFELSFL